jgi:hypothetical protein
VRERRECQSQGVAAAKPALLRRIHTGSDGESLEAQLEMLLLKGRESHMSRHRAFHFAKHIDNRMNRAPVPALTFPIL